ncbi:MAG: hypothetical protein ABJB05_17205 [Parafilimonas sp.]
MVVKKKLFSYKFNDSIYITVNYIGGGATAPDYLKVTKKNIKADKSFTIKILDGFTDDYLFSIFKLNDSTINLRMIDTAYFKGKVLNYKIDINQIDTTFNKYN